MDNSLGINKQIGVVLDLCLPHSHFLMSLDLSVWDFSVLFLGRTERPSLMTNYCITHQSSYVSQLVYMFNGI